MHASLYVSTYLIVHMYVSMQAVDIACSFETVQA